MTEPVRRAPGRRPGGPDTRGEIVAAARKSFASEGFERTSIRGVAREAGVDPALVHHYFDGKGQLFAEAMGLPVDPRLVAARILDGPRDELGERIVATFLGVWEDPGQRDRMTAMLRAVVSSEDAARMLRDGLGRMIMAPVSEVLDAPDAMLRVSLVASHLIGLATARYVLKLEPLASAEPAELVVRVGRTAQHYLLG